MLDASHIARQFATRPAVHARDTAVAGHQPKMAASHEGPSFGELLDQASSQASGELKFSKHAQKRLASRNIDFSAGDMEKLQQAIDVARKKGARDSLVLMGDLALVVSVKNNTVITAVDEGSTKENVFTNIDSAVIAR